MFVEQAHRANHPADFVATLCRAIGWSGETAQIHHLIGHHTDRLSLEDYADAFEGLGLRPVARSCRLSSLMDADLPCLYQDKTGVVRLIADRDEGALIVRDENIREPDSVRARTERVVILQVEDAEQQTEQSTETIRSLLIGQKNSLIGVFLTTIVINLLGISAPLVVLTVYDTAIPTQSVDLLWSLALLAGVLVLMEMSLRVLRAWVIGDAGAHIEQTLSRALFRKLSHLPVQQLQRQSLFQQMTRLKQFDSVRDALTGSFLIPCLDLPLSLIFLGAIMFFSKTVGLVLLGAIVGFMLLALLCTKWQLRVGAEASQHRATYETQQYEIARNRRAIRTFGMGTAFEDRTRLALQKSEAAAIHQRMIHTVVQFGSQSLVALVGVGLVALATLEAMAGTLTFGGLIVIITLIWRVFSPLQALFSNGPRIVGLVSSLQQIDAVLAQDEEMQRLDTRARAKSLDAPLAMKSVFLRFDAIHEPALANVSVEINKGELVALCGPARSGKTCLLNSFAKLLVPGAGSVSIGAIDYRQLAVEDVRQTVSYCTHDNWFFDMTLRDNMRMGNPSLSDEQIRDMLKHIGAINDLRRFRQGLDTVMTPDVIARLSTVQMKTLSVARTLCRTTPVYLIDDAMVGLSTVRANRIWSALEDLKGDRTIIAVSNHADQIAMADRIICLNKGRVALDGAGAADAKAAVAIIQGT